MCHVGWTAVLTTRTPPAYLYFSPNFSAVAPPRQTFNVFRFETRSIHAGAAPDPLTVPVVSRGVRLPLPSEEGTISKLFMDLEAKAKNWP